MDLQLTSSMCISLKKVRSRVYALFVLLDRKPKNQKAKCASYDWERGLGTCHNCNTSFQLHTYQRKGQAEKVYVRPETPDAIRAVSTKVEDWFKTRGISQETLKDLGLERALSICLRPVKPRM